MMRGAHHALSLLLTSVLGLASVGCAHGPHSRRIPTPVELGLPRWFTDPAPDDRSLPPVALGMALPPHLAEFGERHALPGWAVYGVVRALGAEEFVVRGVVRTYSLRDEYGESRHVVEDVHYDVPRTRIEQALTGIQTTCAAGATELERLNALGAHVAQRFGALAQFSLTPLDRRENLLLTTGESHGPRETFSAGVALTPHLGWTDGPDEYRVCVAGAFSYSGIFESFRRAEEQAIQELATGLLVKFSQVQRTAVDTGMTGGFTEDVSKEELALTLRGLRVNRRLINLSDATCFVEIAIPRAGVAYLTMDSGHPHHQHDRIGPAR